MYVCLCVGRTVRTYEDMYRSSCGSRPCDLSVYGGGGALGVSWKGGKGKRKEEGWGLKMHFPNHLYPAFYFRGNCRARTQCASRIGWGDRKRAGVQDLFVLRPPLSLSLPELAMNLGWIAGPEESRLGRESSSGDKFKEASGLWETSEDFKPRPRV